MRRLKIMTDDVPMACGDVFGVNDMCDNLQALCRERGWNMPRFWVFPANGVMMCYAVSLQLKGKDKGEVLDAKTVFVLKTLSEIGNLDALENCYAIKGNKQLAANYYRKCLNLDYYDGKNRVEKKLKELDD